MRFYPSVVALAGLMPGLLGAQATPPTDSADRTSRLMVSHFERSYITIPGLTSGIDGLLFEASIAPPFYVQVSPQVTIVFTPKVVLRMLTAESRPVRTPSYMPRITLYRFKPPTAAELEGGRIHYEYLTVSHFSNGQDGSFRDSLGNLNHVNGSFSTNFVEAGTHFGLRYPGLGEVGFMELSAELHWGYEASEHEDYSDARIHFSQGFSWSFDGPGRDTHDEWSLSATETWLVDDAGPDFTGIKRLTLWATLTWAPSWSGDLSMFANFFTGQDYYNIHFDETLTAIRIGLAATRGRASSAVPAPGRPF